MTGFKKFRNYRSNLILGLLLFFISDCFAEVDSSKHKQMDTTGAVISFESDYHDFGTIKKGEVITYTYKFVNVGNQPLLITNVNTGCDCTTPEWPKEPVKNGEASFIKITYKSEEEGGDQAKEITVTSNASIPIKTLRFTGYVDYSGK